ncbi:phosphodiester glycosidase family protein [Gorillibacterium sp. sgz5001074]|uniref:phosphodiester glycosidase family protein n=1 Tax=Gorillibacterium sp. sgz5001074 TaxID=3446695 RepID=UPI003F66B05C
MQQLRKEKTRSWAYKAGTCLLALFLLSPTAGPLAVPTAFAAPVLELVQEEPLTAGATLKSYVWKSERKGTPVSVNAKVVQVDLQNPYVKLDVMTGTGGQFTKKQTVLGMATETGAVAGVNGDFYNTQAEGVPIGPEIMDGRLMATAPDLPGFYSFAITKDRKPIIDLFAFQGKIVAKDGTSYPLGGINKTYYWYEPSGVHSMIDGLFMYTDAWAQEDRSNDGKTDPTEVLVVNNVVTQIVKNDILHMIAPKNGYILRSAGKAADFVLEHMKVGDMIQADYSMYPQDRTKSYDYKNFQMMIGGHTILVDEGAPAEFSRKTSDIEGYYYRTAVGFSKDQRYVYLITADNSGESSRGLSLSELQNLMIQVGVWRGMNLDGGGSTQLVARPLGETQPRIINDIVSQRKVVNGLGVFSLAPKGQVKGLKVEGPETVLLGETVSYSFKAYDEFYNPVTSAEVKPTWSWTGSLQTAGENAFTALAKGKASITAKAGLATVTKELQVVGKEDLTNLKLEANPPILREGETVTLKATATTKSGLQKEVPPQLIQWEIRGIKGTITGNQLRVDSLNGATQGLVIGRYDGYSSSRALNVGEAKMFVDFDKSTYPISFAATDGVTGLAERKTSAESIQGAFAELSYDFTKGSGTKAAYAVLGNKDITVPGEPEAMRLQVKGDNSLNWIRAEILDAQGQVYRVDLTKAINWTGWKTVTVDLSSYKMSYPIRLTRLYAASVAELQDERSLTGRIGYDEIQFLYKGKDPVLPRNKVVLTIDKPIIQVNGAMQQIDQAPIKVNDNTTMVPIRFVTEALGGTVEWSDAEQKVTLIRGGHMMEFRIGDKDYLADGSRKTALAAPEFRNERTMVPLRVLSEHLGWKVEWVEETRTVTLE